MGAFRTFRKRGTVANTAMAVYRHTAMYMNTAWIHGHVQHCPRSCWIHGQDTWACPRPCTATRMLKTCIFQVQHLHEMSTTITTNPILNYNICKWHFSMCKVKIKALIPLKGIKLCNTPKWKHVPKRVKFKIFTCIVLHQMKNSLPKIQFAINT